MDPDYDDLVAAFISQMEMDTTPPTKFPDN